jgi:selenocysteine lyase/cysteine desulfurase
LTRHRFDSANRCRSWHRRHPDPDAGRSDLAAGITSFRLNGGTSSEQNQRVIEALRDRYGLFTARRTGVARGDCVRVTPAIYSGVADVDRLAAAIKELAHA